MAPLAAAELRDDRLAEVDAEHLARLQAALLLATRHSITAPSGRLRRSCSLSTLKWTRMSPLASSLTMKPKPRVASNHFTVPVTLISESSSSRGAISLSAGAGKNLYPFRDAT
jgi:hypothetical protein